MAETFVGSKADSYFNLYYTFAYTYIPVSPLILAQTDGILRSYTLGSIRLAGTWKIKIFRSDGTNFVFVGESASSSSVSNIPCYLPIKKGDFLGFYGTGSLWLGNSDATQYWRYYGADVTTTTPISSWYLGSGSAIVESYGYVYTTSLIL